MPPAKRRVMAVQPHELSPVHATPAPQRRVGRPPGEASTIVNVRLPLSLVARLDDYLDRLEGQTGLKANRGMIARRALELFLATHQAGASPSARAGRPSGPDEPAVPVRRRRTRARPLAR
jgi:hypothetical protein